MSILKWIQNKDVVSDAFEKRQALMPMWGQGKVAEHEWDRSWEAMLLTPLNPHTLAYINIPFCVNHCVFCGFYRNLWKEDRGTPYVDRLLAELEFEAKNRRHGGALDAVYLGGGTPSALSAKDLSRLIKALPEYLPLADACEITVEGRMYHFDDEKIDACIEAGANRFSIGVQTFDTEIRQKLGRKLAGPEAVTYMKHLAQKEAVVILDLIYGLPGQTDEKWVNDIETALSLGLDGLDIYAFNSYPMLPIHRLIEKKVLPEVPTLERMATQYAYAVRRLMAENWQQISNSHFVSDGGKERNIYNLKIKSGASCLAFGSGAGGNHAGFSYSVTGTLADYLNTPIEKKPLGHMSQTGDYHESFAHIQASLEQGYIEDVHVPKNSEFREQLQSWAEKGLISFEDGRIDLTISGRFWGPTITRQFYQALTQQ